MALALRESSDDNKAAIPFETKHFESLPVLPVCWIGGGKRAGFTHCPVGLLEWTILSDQTSSRRTDGPTGKLSILVLVAQQLLRLACGLQMSLHVLRLCTFSQ
jgi:hypothetical protein